MMINVLLLFMAIVVAVVVVVTVVVVVALTSLRWVNYQNSTSPKPTSIPVFKT